MIQRGLSVFFWLDTYYLHIQGVKVNSRKLLSSILVETNVCTETNDTPEKSSDTQLFGAGKPEGVALLGGHHTHLP